MFFIWFLWHVTRMSNKLIAFTGRQSRPLLGVPVKLWIVFQVAVSRIFIEFWIISFLSKQRKITRLITFVTDRSPGIWGAWTTWSPCTESCGDGVRTRSRTCQFGQCLGAARQAGQCRRPGCLLCKIPYLLWMFVVLHHSQQYIRAISRKPINNGVCDRETSGWYSGLSVQRRHTIESIKYHRTWPTDPFLSLCNYKK